MTDKFDYTSTGFEDRADWKAAAQICFDWIEGMGWGGNADGVNEFMRRQPVAAARRLIELCDDASPESISLALMGPAKEGLLDAWRMSSIIGQIESEFDRAVEFVKKGYAAENNGKVPSTEEATDMLKASVEDMQARVTPYIVFDERTVGLAASLMMPASFPGDDKIMRDVKRIQITEAISAMEDQMLNRTRIDAFHDIRKNMLAEFEAMFAVAGGENPGLDKVFIDSMAKSKEILGNPDKLAAEGKMNVPKQRPPRP